MNRARVMSFALQSCHNYGLRNVARIGNSLAAADRGSDSIGDEFIKMRSRLAVEEFKTIIAIASVLRWLLS